MHFFRTLGVPPGVIAYLEPNASVLFFVDFHSCVHPTNAYMYVVPFQPASFDHIFVCFVLEHLPQPIRALQALKELLKDSATITVIEGDHGSAYFHPDSEATRKAIQCQVELQRRAGGDAQLLMNRIAGGFRPPAQ